MQDSAHQARATAVWIVHTACLANMLRAHGRETHASHLEAAIEEIAEIIAREVGRQELAAAIGRITSQVDAVGGLTPPPLLPH